MIYGNLQTDTCIGPQCNITVYNSGNAKQSKSISVDAIIDTGAAITCIPKSKLQRLNLILSRTITMRDANGGSCDRNVYFAHITIAGSTFENYEVIEISDRKPPHKNYALVGRNILNINKVVLNGVEQKWRLNCGEKCDIANI
ncbi:MAG: clan AA aspartic protease [Okeania sp. SIO3B5]|uniref:retropepsin-like aspartic protease n=1 Tax=Okeania sp. SIO3B5 TaxID=2607811 RepID=UPI0014010D3A|nr:retropepsin-like aspartic protease [Okeania sp. SIO3B5]NEO55749.1 clan AA aspartic protease [Okeania sp. SIO3B5]